MPTARSIAAALLSVALLVTTAEIAVRLLQPTPRAQIVRHDTPGLRPLGDTVTWRLPGDYTAMLENTACPGPDSQDVLLVGDSVLYVNGPSSLGGRADQPEANVSTRLQQLLADRSPRTCLLNLAQPGLLPQQLRLLAREGHARFGASLLLVAVWKDDRSLTEVGGDWYEVDRYRRPPGGLPVPLGLPLPQAVHRPLFDRSALWEYASLALGREDDQTALRFDAYAGLLDDAQQAGLPVLMVEFSPLHQPLAASAAGRPEHHRGVEQLARARGIPYLLLADLLKDHDVAAVRADTCCHLNAAGHGALAEALAPELRRLLGP